jgi:prepilin-type N-terminal cleavage/methylation domain-containing protein
MTRQKINGDEGKMRKQKGFSLIELLIVVAIILIIAAIAIPNLLRAKMSANESSAVGSVRTLVTAQVSYSAACTAAGQGFSATLANLGQPAANPALCPGPMGYIDTQLTTGNKSGYTFTINDLLLAAGANAVNIDFEVEGHPVTPGSTGNRAFCATQQGVVLSQPTGVAVTTRAGCAAPPLVPVAN